MYCTVRPGLEKERGTQQMLGESRIFCVLFSLLLFIGSKENSEHFSAVVVMPINTRMSIVDLVA